jgi:putative hydrolase of the HAD superfamily
MIKAVNFDLWNTLIRDKDYTAPRAKCLANALSTLNILRKYDEIREAYIATHEHVHRVWRLENYRFVTTEERLDHILERLSAPLTGDLKAKVLKEFEETALADPPPLVEGALETLESLSSKYKMGVISDTGLTPGRILRKVLSGHQVLRFLDVTVFSDENGYNKPHRTMFEKALSELKTKPSEVVHVGDLLHTDIAGAKAVGMKAVWLNRRRVVNSGPYKPDYEIKTFPEIIDVLKTIC